jgi:regulator of sigma E protease
VLTETISLFLSNIWLYGILFIAIVTFVIFIHEMGHYLAARAVGVRPELFSIGFGREVIGRTDSYGTRWSLRLYPFGGYVRMFGDAPYPEVLSKSPEELEYAYFNKSVGKRALIAAAGPVMNFLFCIALLSVVYMTIGRPAPALTIMALGTDGGAYKAGLQIGDEVLAIDDIPMVSFEPLKAYVATKTNQVMKVDVKRGDQILRFDVTPTSLTEKNAYGLETRRGSMKALFPNYGLDIREIHTVDAIDTKGNPDLVRELILKNIGREIVINFGRDEQNNFLFHVHGTLNEALRDSDHKDYNVLTLGKRSNETMKRAGPIHAVREAMVLSRDAINSTLGSIFQVIVGTKGVSEMGGVIKISTMTGEMAGKGLYTFLKFVALLSFTIGLINLLPIPMLDGGHLMFQAIEAIKGSPVSLTTKGYIYGFGLIFLLMAILVINLNDLLTVLKLI